MTREIMKSNSYELYKGAFHSHLLNEIRESTIWQDKNVPENLRMAVMTIPRHRFVYSGFQNGSDFPIPSLEDIYSDRVVSQNASYKDPMTTASQPSLVLYMINSLSTTKMKNILEIGSGNGYVLALLAQAFPSVQDIDGIEINNWQVRDSRRVIQELIDEGFENLGKIIIDEGNISKHIPKKYDAIIVSAATQRESEKLRILLESLNDGGQLIAPMYFDHDNNRQVLTLFEKSKHGIKERIVTFGNEVPLEVRFVELR